MAGTQKRRLQKNERVGCLQLVKIKLISYHGCVLLCPVVLDVVLRTIKSVCSCVANFFCQLHGPMKAKNYAHHITYKLDPLLRLEGLARQTKEVLLIKKVVQRDVHDLW